jgi:hypothetical protein
MVDSVERQGAMIEPLEDALALADELNDGGTGYLIECTLDEARAQPFKPFNLSLEILRLCGEKTSIPWTQRSPSLKCLDWI